MALEIRPGTAADAPAVAALHSASWLTTYAGMVPAEALGDGLAEERRELWELRLTVDYGEPANTPLLLLAERGPELDGFAYLVPQPDGRVLLDNLHVRPGLTGGGIGSRLLAACRAHCPDRTLYLEVLQANTRAIAFYERAGAVRTDDRIGWFPGGYPLPEYEYSFPVTPPGH
ncbi:ribosomal protein S18 acetylase RimI-like enzyme [Kitasatospora gansuensis]|uniref:Ribosomal protein S18 acetylase RimI-like enzyme n=1 Tax=Kitasatospora gansuensis TaxID=258050 RepID=A0A7W7SFG9_9ACTN|nr:GNAT family N-acetyltransferase [Kitasatospora gansuensis]MBB4948371.1 ribosomal protein S18 acetylase RimI-like enzyme [Kitasatospora gansuensis]